VTPNPTRPTHVEPRFHWVLLIVVLTVFAAALAINGVVHDQAGRTGTVPETGSPAPPAVTSLGPVIDERMTSGESSEPAPGIVALTFDDGPDPTWTPRILEILEHHDVPATFFVVGARVTQHPDLLRRTVESGHEIGVHTFTHSDLGQVSLRQARIELSQTQLAISAAAGQRTALMRPPFSSTPSALDQRDHAALTAAVQDGYVAVLATHDTQDWSRPGADAIVERALPSDGQGAIVLLHDGGGDRQQTVTALEELIPRLKDEGYEFATVTEAIGHPDAVVAAPSQLQWRGTLLLGMVRVSEVVVAILGWALAVLGVLTAARVLLLLVAAGVHARVRRRTAWGREVLEPVTVIVPAYNEAAGVAKTVRSVYDSAYPYLEIIVVDDGSTDGTAHEVEALGLAGVRVISQPNRGKAAAIQAGIDDAQADVIVLLDGDTIFERDTIHRLVQPFADPGIGAVAGNAKVGNRRSLLGRWQHIEYVIGFNLDRRLYDLLGCMPTVPGAVGAFRRRALADAGGITADTLAEDTDLTMAVIRAGWRIVYEEDARAWTEAPATLGELWRQRYRWCYGTLQAVWKHRRALVSRGPAGRLGRRGLTYVGLFHFLLPLLGPVLDLFLVYGLLFLDPGAVALIWLGFLGVQLLLGVVAFHLDREPMAPLVWLPLQQFVYRQLMYLVVIQSVVTAIAGATLRWHKLERRGDAQIATVTTR